MAMMQGFGMEDWSRFQMDSMSPADMQNCLGNAPPDLKQGPFLSLFCLRCLHVPLVFVFWALTDKPCVTGFQRQCSWRASLVP